MRVKRAIVLRLKVGGPVRFEFGRFKEKSNGIDKSFCSGPGIADGIGRVPAVIGTDVTIEHNHHEDAGYDGEHDHDLTGRGSGEIGNHVHNHHAGRDSGEVVEHNDYDGRSDPATDAEHLNDDHRSGDAANAID